MGLQRFLALPSLERTIPVHGGVESPGHSPRSLNVNVDPDVDFCQLSVHHNATYEPSFITKVKPPRVTTSPPCRGGWWGSGRDPPEVSLSSVRGSSVLGDSTSVLANWTTRDSSGPPSGSAPAILWRWATFWVSVIHSYHEETRELKHNGHTTDSVHMVPTTDVPGTGQPPTETMPFPMEQKSSLVWEV